MSRYIDADALINDLEYDIAIDEDILNYVGTEGIERANTQFDKDCKQNAIDLLMNAPSIDIVRCKECKWLRYCETEDLDMYLDCDKPDGGGIPQNEEWFCADGEREGE